MHKVMILDAEYDNCNEAVKRAFEVFPIDLKGKKIMVKPNALRANAPEEAVTTHPSVLRAVIEELEKYNPADIIVGDNPGMAHYGANEETFKKTGLLEAAGKYYRNIGSNASDIEISSRFYKTVGVSNAILDADIYISLPKFKTHGLTILSGAIKNNYGILPGAQKADGHCTAGNPYNFHELVVDIYAIRIPDLIIVDGILGMEGNGPVSTDLRPIGKILVSDNGVAMDATISRMMGYDPANLHFLQVAKKMGYGDFEADKIDLLGELVTIPNFKLPPSAHGHGDGTPSFGREFIERLANMRPKVDESICTGCGTCVDECPAQALSLIEAYPEVATEKCIACFCCQEKCPEKAIQLQ
jgi:uncharacterized protein (DUF362 family)/NAD-dependent dihydropyrimidine dehydrogenase PreA subunit